MRRSVTENTAYHGWRSLIFVATARVGNATGHHHPPRAHHHHHHHHPSVASDYQRQACSRVGDRGNARTEHTIRYPKCLRNIDGSLLRYYYLTA